jgi:hypothetical protein
VRSGQARAGDQPVVTPDAPRSHTEPEIVQDRAPDDIEIVDVVDVVEESRRRHDVRLWRRWAIPALEVAGAVAVVLVLLWPVTIHAADRFAGILDAPYQAWLGWRVGELWRQGGVFSLTIPDAVAPMGLDLRLIDGLFPVWVTAVWNLVTGNIFLGYNLALATGVGLNLWAGRRLGQVLSPKRTVWNLTGVVFATAPALSGALNGQITFVYAFTLPLLLRRAILLARGEDRRLAAGPIVSLAGLFLLAYLCSAYHLVFGALMFGLVLMSWPHSAIRRRDTAVQVGAVVVLAALLLAPFLLTRMRYEADERSAGSPAVLRGDESVVFGADAVGVLTPPDSRWITVPVPRADLSNELDAPLRPVFAGYLALAAVAILAFLRVPARRPLLATAAVLWLLSLGSALRIAGHEMLTGPDGAPAQWLPYRLLFLVPGLAGLRVPTRVNYALVAVLAAVVAVVLDRTLQRYPSRRARASFVGLAVVAIVLSINLPVATSDLALSAETRAGLETVAHRSGDRLDDPGDGRRDGLLVVPWGCRLDDPRIIALQSVHLRPSVGCSASTKSIRWFSGLDPWAGSADLAALRCKPGVIDRRRVPFSPSVRLDEAGVARLRADLGVRYVVIDRSQLPNRGCASAAAAVPLLLRYDKISDDGEWVIVDLDQAPPR